MQLIQYITEHALILIPALYVVGRIIYGTEKISNKYIPFILLILGILGAVGLMGLSADAIIQGILVTGTTVYADQVCKQCVRKTEEK